MYYASGYILILCLRHRSYWTKDQQSSLGVYYAIGDIQSLCLRYRSYSIKVQQSSLMVLHLLICVLRFFFVSTNSLDFLRTTLMLQNTQSLPGVQGKSNHVTGALQPLKQRLDLVNEVEPSSSDSSLNPLLPSHR